MYVAEYSNKQECFHVDTLEKSLKMNIGAIINKYNNDYLIFGVFKTWEEAHAACDKLREKMKDFQIDRNVED